MTLKKYAIIVAGGIGQRMGSKIPKQFLEMKGRPIIMRTMEAFFSYSNDIKIILVLPGSHFITWQSLAKRYQFKIPIVLQKGGETRFQSVKKGLQKIAGPGLVAVHDGVRPVISPALISKSYLLAEQKGSAVAAISLKQSLRKVTKTGSKACDRSRYKLIQTPQTFQIDRLKSAYKINESAAFTDDASVWEAAGNQVNLFEGSPENIKITTLHDLKLAEVLLKFI